MGFAQTGFLVCIFFGSLVHVFTINTNNSILYQFPSSNQPTGDCSASTIKKLTHLTVDPVTGRVYVGGKNRLIQLDSSLTVQECLITGPKEDSVLCHARGCDPSTQIEKVLTDNYNKILVIDHEARTLISCGSIFQGACEKYKLNNISLDSHFYPHNIAANDESSSTYAFIGPEHYNWKHSNVLYVGTTFTNNGEYRPDVPAISSRALNTLEIAEFSYSKQSLLRIDVKYRDHFLVKYIYGFNSSDYAYFVIVQKQSHLPGQEEQGYVTRLARICINDANYDSYTEITIQCMVNIESESITYNLLQDAKLSPVGDELASSLGIQSGDSVLVATFSPSKTITNEPLPHSALCVFSMADIEAKFNENIHMCFNGSIKYRNMPYISGPILDGNCPVAWVSINLYDYFLLVISL